MSIYLFFFLGKGGTQPPLWVFGEKAKTSIINPCVGVALALWQAHTQHSPTRLLSFSQRTLLAYGTSESPSVMLAGTIKQQQWLVSLLSLWAALDPTLFWPATYWEGSTAAWRRHWLFTLSACSFATSCRRASWKAVPFSLCWWNKSPTPPLSLRSLSPPPPPWEEINIKPI